MKRRPSGSNVAVSRPLNSRLSEPRNTSSSKLNCRRNPWLLQNTAHPSNPDVRMAFSTCIPRWLRTLGVGSTTTTHSPECCDTSARGDKVVYTIRVGTQRIRTQFTLRKLCDIVDQYVDGHVRFTIRSNLEVMVTDEAKVQPLIKAMEAEGFVVGGTKNSVAPSAHKAGCTVISRAPMLLASSSR